LSFLRLVKWELFKLSRQRASYIGFLLCLAFVIVMLVGFGLSDFRQLKASARGLDLKRMITGPFFANFTLEIGFFAVMPLLAATLGGSQLAGEAKDGTLRALLVRPPSRAQVFLAKTLATWLWLQLLMFFLVGLALLCGLVAFGGGNLTVFVWEFRKQGVWIVEDPEWWKVLFLGSVGATLSLFVVASLSMFLSSITDTPVVAHVGTLGAFFISSILQRLPEQLVGDELRQMLPTSHMNFWHEVYRIWDPVPDSFDRHRFFVDVGWCVGFTVVFLGAGLWWFGRKDVTS